MGVGCWIDLTRRSIRAGKCSVLRYVDFAVCAFLVQSPGRGNGGGVAWRGVGMSIWRAACGVGKEACILHFVLAKGRRPVSGAGGRVLFGGERASERIASQICLGEKRRGEKWVMRRGMRVYLRVLLAMGAICDVGGGGVRDGRWQTTWAMFECNVDSERKGKEGGEAGFVAMLVGLRDGALVGDCPVSVCPIIKKPTVVSPCPSSSGT